MSIPKEPRYIELRDKCDFETGYIEAFRHWSNEKALGEASPTYLFAPYVAKLLYQHYPNARLISILRDPIKRAYSDWWMFYSKGIEKLSFREAVLKNLERMADARRFNGRDGEERWKRNVWGIEHKRRITEPFYIDVGHFGEQINKYFSLFPSEQIQIIFMDELASNPNRTLSSLCEFLGVASCFQFEVGERLNQALGAVPEFILQLFRSAQSARLPRFTPEFIKEAVRNWLRRRGARPKIDKETYYLLKEHYRGDVNRLEHLLSRKLDGWLD